MTVESEFTDEESFKFFGLGGCNEVGRSCHIIEYKNKVIMLDAGIHPALSGHSSFPFYDEYDLSKVDILLISHFHLDHAASLPYVMQSTTFNGRVFMTSATKAIYRWLLQDFVRVTSIGNARGDAGGTGQQVTSSNLYTDEDIMKSFDKIETIDYHSTMEIEGIRFTAYHAGHVLGACMYFIEIGGLKILFTGDYSREENRHLHAAEVPPIKPDILISESTFGTGTLEPKAALENKLTSHIHATILKGGRVLLPVFALGNAQELLLILDEYWNQNEDLQGFNIYYASTLAKKCMAVYETYTSIMNDNIRLSTTSSTSGKRSNPFDFKFVKSIKDLSRFQDMGPSVVIATPGMLQAGVSRQLLEKWAPDPKNLVIMTGYSVEGTMAKDLLKEPHTIQSASNSDMTIPRRIGIEEISFAAHVDFVQNSEFIEKVNPSRIILVHGDSIPMGRLKSALLSKYSSRRGTEQEIKVYNPKNCEELKIGFKGMKVAKVLGSLAEEQLVALKNEIANKIKEDNGKITDVTEDNQETTEQEQEPTENGTTTKDNTQIDIINTGQIVSGVLVQKDFDLNLLQLQDLHEFTQLATSIVKSKISLKINADIPLMIWHLEQMFGYVNIINDDDEEWECEIMEMVDILIDRTQSSAGLVVTVEWINDNLMADSLADSVIAILYSIDSSPASVKISSSQHRHHNHKEAHSETGIESRIKRISLILKAQFGDSLQELDNAMATITIGKNVAKIDYNKLTVECGSKVLKDRIENIIRRGTSLTAPLSKYQKV
ncbi:YSH1 [[Candida] subhashii]|uniref:Endoribonuclease YSH1 n=1 Tax=[Candida] subhashii TaxID=561895 RepID=A0A8J5UIS4_9ASCO|nr:YSH1 [[Candida] subhashii]KAG7661352.1 YSH1 [[Candida] subhashii]